MTTVSRRPGLPAGEDVLINRPASSVRLAVPTARTINHITGHLLGGLRSAQVCGSTPTDTDDTARIVTWRYPNCDYIDVVGRLAGSAKADPWTIVAQAGAGIAQTISSSTTVTDGGEFRIRCPWDPSDTGYQEITVAYTDIAIRALSIWDVPREDLETGDVRVDLLDASYSRIGVSAERYIAASSTAGTDGVTASVTKAWDDYHPQMMGWWTSSSQVLSSSATSFGGAGSSSDFFGGAKLRGITRKKAAATTSATNWWLRTWCDLCITGYEIKVTVGSNSTTVSRSNTSASWGSVIGPISGSNAGDVALTFEGRYTSGFFGSIYLSAVSGLGA